MNSISGVQYLCRFNTRLSNAFEKEESWDLPKWGSGCKLAPEKLQNFLNEYKGEFLCAFRFQISLVTFPRRAQF